MRSTVPHVRPRPPRLALARVAVLCLAASSPLLGSAAIAADTPTPDQVIGDYADIAMAVYNDALDTARGLNTAIDALLDDPNEATLDAARAAWRDARVPYQQSEVYRFGNPVVGAWEGRVNAWPLDASLIDYIDTSHGAAPSGGDLGAADIIAAATLEIDGRAIDASEVTPELLRDELEVDGIGAGAVTGYRAIEFLLWGQDLNGTGPGAGTRPATDYDVDDCTNGHCERRRDYLDAAGRLLADDLEEMASSWQDGGEARAAITGLGDKGALTAVLTGMGSLSYGELAGERLQLGLGLHDPQKEHDGFSDNTAAFRHFDGLGIRNVWRGRYERPDGEIVEGESLARLVAATHPALAEEMEEKLDASVAALRALHDSQLAGRAYDQLIAEGDTEGNALVQRAIDALIAQTRSIERVASALDLTGVTLEGSGSLDAPSDPSR